MSRIIDQSELGIVADTLIKESNAKITSLCAMYGPIDAFRDDPGLAGAAWSALKSQMNDHYLVIKSLILAYGYVVDDATVLKGIIGGEVELLDEAQ
ncbi:MAG: hypothetical protein FWE25_10785, partial [Lachnospiraceae bacterium]|nr:hypothetical protein [Lachnospiraceae bacterium]